MYAICLYFPQIHSPVSGALEMLPRLFNGEVTTVHFTPRFENIAVGSFTDFRLHVETLSEIRFRFVRVVQLAARQIYCENEKRVENRRNSLLMVSTYCYRDLP
jgi:hypothetical protein